MSTGFAGSLFRLYPWQTKHYLVRGGPFDPVIQTSGLAGSLTGGYLQVATSITLGPVPGTQTPPNVPLPRVQSQISTGALTVATGVLGSNNGGVYIGTIPGGAWIDSVEMFVYTALSGGSATSVGIFYTPSENQVGAAAPGFQPATMYCLAYQTTPVINTLYTTSGFPGSNGLTGPPVACANWTGWSRGPGNGPSSTSWPTITQTTLASDGPPGGEGFGGAKDLLAGGAASIPGDIDLYFVNFLIAGSGTANTAGNFQVKIEFTGLAG